MNTFEYHIFKLRDDEMNAEKIITNGAEELLTKNEQLVLQHCRAKEVEWRCCAFYRPDIKPVLQQIRLLTGLNMGGKTRNISSLFNSFCSNVAKQVALFFCPFFRILISWPVLTNEQLPVGLLAELVRALYQNRTDEVKGSNPGKPECSQAFFSQLRNLRI